MTAPSVELTLADEGVATLTLNRPEALNAFAGTMREDLLAALEEASSRARVVVWTGAGGAFSSGGDLKAMAELRRAGDVETLRRLVRTGKQIVRRLWELPIPTLAAVDGVAAGAGLSLALACDLRLASERSRFGATFGRIGLHPDWGATYFLPRLVGPAVASEMILTGRLLSASEALAVGLVSRLVSEDRFAAEVRELAAGLSRLAPLAVERAKEALRRSPRASLQDMLDYEEEAQVVCFSSADCLEGLAAFEAKRAPRFKGK
jgi:2-(1,2-epoxy-1,2-dihydrophenyl)acetyl-CoA isomerase